MDSVEVVHAHGEGDDTIAAIADANRDLVVVTADRELSDRVRPANAEVVRPNWLRSARRLNLQTEAGAVR